MTGRVTETGSVGGTQAASNPVSKKTDIHFKFNCFIVNPF
jgi:hypothetical protein